LSENFQPESDTSEIPVTVCEPSSWSACWYVAFCAPPSLLKSTRASLERMRLPVPTQRFCVQPVEVRRRTDVHEGVLVAERDLEARRAAAAVVVGHVVLNRECLQRRERR
jgi:hypothetical protein